MKKEFRLLLVVALLILATKSIDLQDNSQTLFDDSSYFDSNGSSNNSSSNNINSNGWTELTFTGPMQAQSNYDGNFTTHVWQNMAFPSPFLDNQSMSLDQQIDSQFGNEDGNLSIDEWQLFSNYSANQSLLSIPGILLDSQIISVNVTMQNITFEGAFPHIVGSEVNYSWYASGNFSGQRANLPLAQLSVSHSPTGIIHHPVTIILNSPVEYRYSPPSVEVSGSPSNFTVYYPSISSFYVVTFGDNTPPSSQLVTPSASHTSIDWVEEQHFEVSTSDAGLNHGVSCEWNFSTPTVSVQKRGKNVSLNPSNISIWDMGQTLQVISTCNDYHGESAVINHSWGLDGQAPSVNWLNATVGCGENDDSFAEENILNCDSLSIPAGTRIEIFGNISDDFTPHPLAIWSSDKTPNWWQEGKQISIIFYQGPQSNSFDDPVEERYLARNTSTNVLNFTVSDDAGHVWQRTWDVYLLDNQPPSVRPNVLANDIPVSSSHSAHEGDEISVTMNESFDDISAIEDIRWWFDLDSVPLEGMQNISWQEARYFSLGKLGGGYHWVNITSQDGSGNQNIEPYPLFIMVQPKAELDLQIIQVHRDESSDSSLSPNMVRLLVTIQNNGGQSGPFQLCVEKQCVNQTAVAATADGPGISTHNLELDLAYGADTTVMVAWFDANDELNFAEMESGISITREYSAVEKFAMGAVIVTILVGLWWRSKSANEGKSK